MSDTLSQPTNPAEQAEVDYGEHVIWRLTNSTIVAFGANLEGQILLSTVKNGVRSEFVIGVDERGDIALFETVSDEPARPQDWTEDYHDPDGTYECECRSCGIGFVGFKRRVLCKVCSAAWDNQKVSA